MVNPDLILDRNVYEIPRFRDEKEESESDTLIRWFVRSWNEFQSRVPSTARDMQERGLIGRKELGDLVQKVRELGRTVTDLELRNDLNHTTSELDEVTRPESLNLSRKRRDLAKKFPSHRSEMEQVYRVIDELWGMGEISRKERDTLMDQVNGFDRFFRGLIGTLEKIRF